MDTLDKQHQDYKNYGNQELSFLDGQELPTLLTALIRKNKTEKNLASKDTRLPFTIWSFLDIWIFKKKKFSKKISQNIVIVCDGMFYYCVKSKYQPL